jgi:flagellin-like hook-associated protein FlgL
MAAEIDRIANATNFNGIKLLDGSVTNQHGGQGLKIHFGVSNNPAEDYYFVNIGDARATSSTGLQIGGDAKNDIWGQGAAGSGPLAGPGCCTTGYSSINGTAGFLSGQTFSYGYNWDWTEDNDSALLSGRYLAGRYTVSSSDSLQDLINKVNKGSQSRVGIELDAADLHQAVSAGGTVAVCIGNEAYYWGNSGVAVGGESFTSSYIFSLESEDFVTANGYWATGALAALLNPNSPLSLETELAGGLDTAAGAAALRQAALEALQGNVLDTNALNATSPTVVNAALLNRLGIREGGAPLAAQDFGVGIYGSATLGYWTDSASLAQTLNFTEYRLDNVSAYIATSVAATVVNSALVKALGFTSGQVAPGTTLTIYSCANGWTTSASIAAFLGLGDVTTINAFNVTDTAGDAVDVITPAYFTTLTDPALGTATLSARAAAGNMANTAADGLWFNANNVHTGVFVSASTGLWTQSATIGSKFGMTEVTINLSSSTIHTSATATSLQTTVNNAFLAANNSKLPSGGVLMSAGIYTNLDGTLWTSSEALAGRLGFVEFTFMAQPGTDTWGEAMTDFQTAYNGKFAGGLAGARAVSHVGDDATDADAKFADALQNIRSAPFGREVTAYDDSYTAMAGNLTAAGISGDKQYTNLTGPDAAMIADIITDINAELGAALTTQIVTRSITNADINGLGIAANMTYAEGDGSVEIVEGVIDSSKEIFQVATNGSDVSLFTAAALASAINANANGQFWAMVQQVDSNGRSADMVYIFTKEGGNFNDLLACDVAGSDSDSRAGLNAVNFENVANAEMLGAGTTFTLGGEYWASMKPIQTGATLGNEVWNVTLIGRDVGDQRDIWIANGGEIVTPGLDDSIINGMNRDSFVEIQNAANGNWAGAEVRTQSAAQEALDAISEAINKKDKIRADLGALQNRLENTMTNLTIQAENLQASESRISDVDVALEMTEFTRNNVLSQAATSMLAQANSLSQLALSLIR